MEDLFTKIKNTVKISDYLSTHTQNTKNPKRIRFDKCPFCGHRGCADIRLDGKQEQFFCSSAECGKNGSIIDVYGYVNNIDPKTTEGRNKIVKRMCEEFHISDDSINEDIKKKVPGAAAPIKPKEEEKEYNFNDVVEKLHKQLLNSNKGMKYFKDRGLTEEVIKRFKLGYDKKGINAALKDYPEIIGKKSEDYSECYPYFIPVFENGMCKNFIVRRDEEIFKRNSEKNSFLIGKPKVLNLANLKIKFFNFTEAMKKDYIFICEGWCDALSLELLGYGAVALNGASNTEKFVENIKKYDDFRSKAYIIAFDNDSPGEKAREKLEKQLQEANCNVKHIHPIGEEVKDINDMLLLDSYSLKEAAAEIVEQIEEEKESFDIQDSNFQYLQNTLEKFKRNKDRKILSTGFKRFDNSLGGGLYNNLYVIGGISGLGKTSIVLNIVENLAKQEQDVLYISLEMSRDELIAKSLSRFIHEESINNFNCIESPTQREIQNGNFGTNQQLFNQAIKEYEVISKHIFTKEANFNYNTNLIRNDIKDIEIKKGKPPVLVVDYLQILKSVEDYQDEKRNIDLNISELKRISRDFNIPVIVISSINRRSYNESISFEGFKNSGGIEFTADVVVGLQYSYLSTIDKKNKFDKSEYDTVKAAEIKDIQTVVLKNRNGSIGNYTNFKFESKYSYFRESEGI